MNKWIKRSMLILWLPLVPIAGALTGIVGAFMYWLEDWNRKEE